MGVWIAVWQSTANLGGAIGNDFDILFARSLDAGNTWTPPQPLNSTASIDAPSDKDENPQIAWDGGQRWIAVWQSTYDLAGTGGEGDILFATSLDDGQSWSPPQAVSDLARTDANKARDTHPALATDGSGAWIVAWQSKNDLGKTLNGSSNLLFAASANRGASWSPTRALNLSATGAGGGSDENPRLATDGRGRWLVAWESRNPPDGSLGHDGEILYAVSDDLGAAWSQPLALNSNAGSDASRDEMVDIRAYGRDLWLASWKSTENLGGMLGVDGDVLLALSLDNGSTWEAPMPLTPTGSGDAGADTLPRLATDGTGQMAAVWQSANTAAGQAGADEDIFFATKSILLLSPVQDDRPEPKLTIPELNEQVRHDSFDPKTMRLFYVNPANRTPQPDYAERLRYLARLGQKFFYDQQPRNGFEPKTYTIETEADGVTPAVYTLDMRLYAGAVPEARRLIDQYFNEAHDDNGYGDYGGLSGGNFLPGDKGLLALHRMLVDWEEGAGQGAIQPASTLEDPKPGATWESRNDPDTSDSVAGGDSWNIGANPESDGFTESAFRRSPTSVAPVAPSQRFYFIDFDVTQDIA